MAAAITPFFRKAGFALLLGAFAFGVAGDPVTDLLSTHEGSCDVCSALADGHGVASPDTGPVLLCDFVVTAEISEYASSPVVRARRRVFLSRAPPAYYRNS